MSWAEEKDHHDIHNRNYDNIDLYLFMLGNSHAAWRSVEKMAASKWNA